MWGFFMAKVTTDLVQQNPSGAYQAPVVIAVNADGTPISGGGGGGHGGGAVEVRNFPATQAVSGTVTATGPLTNAQFTAVTGSANAAMWDGVAASATLIAILKNMQEQGEALKRIGNETNALLVQVAEHTRQISLNTAPPEA